MSFTRSIFSKSVFFLGLIGMSSFMVERRIREIGIRKVLGAQVSQIMGLLLVQFARPVVWANFIAWLIVGGLAYRAAKNSPIHALRSE